MERVETKMERQLLEALRIWAAEERREEYEVIEDAARLYLGRRHPSITELIERARERRERAGVRELPEDEADRRCRATRGSIRTLWRVLDVRFS